MTTVLCTLYNSLYLDKGLVLYDSLCACAKDFKLYVLCMDEKCYEVLNDLNHPNHIPIRLEDFERGDNELLEAKKNRSFGEYCWTCTPSVIYYVINKYKECNCTYIDADMFFYQDPKILIDSMLNEEKSVLIVPHRFTEVNKEMERNGLYCVEFNTFMNTPSSMEVLRSWRDDCIACCTSVYDGVHFGDQKYLDEWPDKYDCVKVCSHFGAGIAPWNIQSYTIYSHIGNNIKLKVKSSKEIVDLIFYHFHNVEYVDDKLVKINVYSKKYNVQYILVKILYKDYLSKIEDKKTFLQNNYDIDIKLRKHPAFSHEKDERTILERIKQMTLSKLVTNLFIRLNRKKDFMKL